MTESKSSYPVLFDGYYQYPTEIAKNDTILSLLAVDRMIDNNCHNEIDDILMELHAVDVSIETAAAASQSSFAGGVTTKDEKDTIMELLRMDQLVDNCVVEDGSTVVLDPFAKGRVFPNRREQFYIDCTTMSNSTFQCILSIDESIEKLKREDKKMNDIHSMLDLLQVDEEIDGCTRKYDPIEVIMQELVSVDMDMERAASSNQKHPKYQNEVLVDTILRELVKVDQEMDHTKLMAHPTTQSMLDVLYIDRLIDTKVVQNLLQSADKRYVTDYVYDHATLRESRYYTEQESLKDIEDGHNPILIDLWDVDYEVSHSKIVGSSIYKAFHTIYGIDNWVDKCHQEVAVDAEQGLDRDILDLLKVDHMVQNYNQQRYERVHEIILKELLEVDRTIDRCKGAVSTEQEILFSPSPVKTSTQLVYPNETLTADMNALLAIDQQMDGYKREQINDMYEDTWNDLLAVDEEVERAEYVQQMKNNSMRLNTRTEDDAMTTGVVSASSKRSIFSGQEKHMAMRHSSLSSREGEDTTSEVKEDKKKEVVSPPKKLVNKLKVKNVCVVM